MPHDTATFLAVFSTCNRPIRPAPIAGYALGMTEDLPLILAGTIVALRLMGRTRQT